MTSDLNPEQSTTAKLLVREHDDLQQQLLELNRDLDDQLSRRGQGLSRVQPITKPLNSQADKLAAKNEHQKKVNDELARQLIVVDALAKTDEMKQRLQSLTLQCESLRNENKSLENIYSNQQQQTSFTDKVELEMKRAKGEHQEEIQRLKEAARQLKEMRETEADQLRHLHRAEAKLEIKIKATADPQACTSIGDLEALIGSKERQIETVKEQIFVLSKASTNKARARSLNDKRAKELEELRSEADLLREKLDALQINEEL